MPRSRRLLCVAYAAVALLALVATWAQNLSYFGGGAAGASFAASTGRFWSDTLATPASTSITVDLLLLLLPLLAWMVIEARRLEIRFVWLYVLFGSLVAISVTFPLFLIARERRLLARAEASPALGLAWGDALVLGMLWAGTAAFALWTVARS